MAEKLSDTAIVRDAKGKKLCGIKTYQSLKDYFKSTEVDFPLNKPFTWMEIKNNVPVWKDPEAVVSWAWKQLISINKDLRNNNLPCTCILCGEKSIWARNYPIINKCIGICCTNPKCEMFNVIIPAKMIEANIEDIPPDKIMKILGV